MHAHAHIHICVHMHMGHPLPPQTPIYPPQPPMGTLGISKSLIKLGTNRDISILFEDLKSVETPPPMDGCMVWWVGGQMDDWVNGWGHVKSLNIK